MVRISIHRRRRRKSKNIILTKESLSSSPVPSLLVLRFIVLAAVLHAAANSSCCCMMVVTRAARSLNSVRSRSVAATAISAAAPAGSAGSGPTSSSTYDKNSRSSSKKRSSSSSSTVTEFSSIKITKNKNSINSTSKSRKQPRTSAAETNNSVSQNKEGATTSSSSLSRKLKAVNNNQNANEASNTEKKLLLSLPEDIVVGILQARPSTRNRSPYVGDVMIPSQNNRVAICHLPNLDMGGKCMPGATIVMKPARDKKGNLVGPDAVSPKFGTPKCEYIAQLLRVDESHLAMSTANSDSCVQYEPVWVGAHPSLGEKIAEQLIGQNLLGDDFPEVESFQREVRNPSGLGIRADFVVKHTDPTKRRRIVEVKTVVDTDYSPYAIPSPPSSLSSPPSSPDGKTKKSKAPKKICVFTSSRVPYRRTGIFPWGNSNQKGPDGEPVVSTRAIKHVRELTRVVIERQHKKKKNKTVAKKKEEDDDGDDKGFDSTILFVVIRGDAKAFRPNIDACPSFARYLKEAHEAGVTILAKQVVWGEESDNQLGQCYEGPLLEIEWP